MRICVVGSGIAGALLAWRLRRSDPRGEVRLVTAPAAPPGEATAASGGLVRGFEADPAACRLACESLAELRGDSALAAWADYRETGSVYALAGPEDPGDRLALIEEFLPGSAEPMDASALAREHGLAVPRHAQGMVERHAGYFRPDQLRRMIARDLRARGATVVTGPARRVLALPDGGVAVDCPGAVHPCDAVVLATGWRTGALLRRSGLDGPDHQPPSLRTKLIQYDLYDVTGRRPSCFVDETSGLYGRPDGADGMLLGVPSDRWDAEAEHLRASPDQRRTAEHRAAERLPELTLRRHRRTVVAADAYSSSGLLELRPTEMPSLYTFTGGSGGAAKSALAASRQCADRLLGGAPDR
ncbi:NAD(P)/FAD-dependent oxidoreductase [Streptomyces sp. NPDC059063]|uniref:NAD(P)/FAD-dependent oxidoreductase n=1 Tax=unclassified Streptomyces TaxID=2593676 RepID=UPI0036984FD0